MQRTMDHSPREAIIVVAIDEESLKTYGQFPWERDVFVPFFDHVSRARAVLFDIMFNTDGKDRESDRRFAEALARHDNVILAASPVTETAVSRTLRAKAGELLPVHGVNPPIPAFAESADVGHIFRHADEDGVTRRVHLAVRAPEGVVYSAAYLAAERYGADAESFLRKPAKTKPFGAGPGGEMLIRFNAADKDFLTVPFHLVGETDSSMYHDAIVLVGVTATGEDTGATAVDKSMTLVYARTRAICMCAMPATSASATSTLRRAR